MIAGSITRRVKPVWILRLSLGFSYLYSGYDLLVHPTGWYWAVRGLPQFAQAMINNSVGVDIFLQSQGVVELMIADIDGEIGREAGLGDICRCRIG